MKYISNLKQDYIDFKNSRTTILKEELNNAMVILYQKYHMHCSVWEPLQTVLYFCLQSNSNDEIRDIMVFLLQISK